ncbi:MAG: HAD-IA family hydrolase [Ktedonobacteraceae bacterium]
MYNNRNLPPKAVFFDLDDTLFDHLHSTRQGLQTICRAYPKLQQHPIDALFADYTRLLDEVHLRVLEGSLTIDEARVERFRRFFLLHGSDIENIPTAIEHAARLHRETYQANRQVVVGAVPLLEHLHGKVKIVVVTNNVVVEQIEKLRYLKLDHFIDELVVSEETGFIKPDPRIFQIALQRVGYGAEEVVMIGDAWKADIVGATQAGIRAIWLNRTGIGCPDPELAIELRSFEPLEEVVDVILGEVASSTGTL